MSAVQVEASASHCCGVFFHIPLVSLLWVTGSGTHWCCECCWLNSMGYAAVATHGASNSGSNNVTPPLCRPLVVWQLQFWGRPSLPLLKKPGAFLDTTKIANWSMNLHNHVARGKCDSVWNGCWSALSSLLSWSWLASKTPVPPCRSLLFDLFSVKQGFKHLLISVCVRQTWP